MVTEIFFPPTPPVFTNLASAQKFKVKISVHKNNCWKKLFLNFPHQTADFLV